MAKNLIMFKEGQGVVELYDINFSFTRRIGRIYFQKELNGGVFIGWWSSYDLVYTQDILREIADVRDEFYINKELRDQIGVI